MHLLSECENVILWIPFIRFPVHRNVLHVSSEYFATLFATHSPSEVLQLQDVDGATLGQLIKFCYTQHITISTENVANILARCREAVRELLFGSIDRSERPGLFVNRTDI